jgi:hypothetical protein
MKTPDTIFKTVLIGGKSRYESDDFVIIKDEDGWRWKIKPMVFCDELQACGYATSIHFWKTKKGLISGLKAMEIYPVVVEAVDGVTAYAGYKYVDNQFLECSVSARVQK